MRCSTSATASRAAPSRIAARVLPLNGSEYAKARRPAAITIVRRSIKVGDFQLQVPRNVVWVPASSPGSWASSGINIQAPSSTSHPVTQTKMAPASPLQPRSIVRGSRPSMANDQSESASGDTAYRAPQDTHTKWLENGFLHRGRPACPQRQQVSFKTRFSGAIHSYTIPGCDTCGQFSTCFHPVLGFIGIEAARLHRNRRRSTRRIRDGGGRAAASGARP